MPYVHLTTTCFANSLGGDGLDRTYFELMLDRLRAPLKDLQAIQQDGKAALFGLPAQRDDLAALAPVAEAFRANFDDVIVLATGGSSLGGRALVALAGPGYGAAAPTPRLHFLDNVDPHNFDALLGGLNLDRTGFLVISKSGRTAETLAQFLVSLDAVKVAAGEFAVAEHFTIITEPADNPLRRLADANDIQVLDHEPEIGGRYAALSVVGLLPAMIAGVDVVRVREGASEVLEALSRSEGPDASEPAIGAAISVGLARERDVGVTVMMPYADRLADFALWFRQLWAESLGKGGNGTTPVQALGTVDQHSQLQLYLDGPCDKMFTLIFVAGDGVGRRILPEGADDGELSYLAGHTLGDLMEAEQQATAKSLVKSNRPTRIFRLKALDERALGGLMMHFMLETILAAALLGVDPFDQPAVENGKALAREIGRASCRERV